MTYLSVIYLVDIVCVWWWCAALTGLNIFCRLPNRWWRLLYPSPLLSHFYVEFDTLCTGPPWRGGSCYRIRRELFHRGLHTENHWNYQETWSQQGTVLNIYHVTLMYTTLFFVFFSGKIIMELNWTEWNNTTLCYSGIVCCFVRKKSKMPKKHLKCDK